MKHSMILAGLALPLTACAAEEAAAPQPAFAQSAAQVADAYQTALQGELGAALKQVGPVGAIGVCQSVAPAIAADMSNEGKFTVSRIARRNRNPGNAVPAELEAL